jgi:hypothetical protein
LLSNDRRDAHIDTQTDWKRFMKYEVVMGSGAMTYISSFIKIRSGIQKFMGGEVS